MHHLVKGQATSHGGTRQPSYSVNTFCEHHPHSHEEMGLQMAVKSPHSWILCLEPQSSPSVRKQRHRVTKRRIHQVVFLWILYRIKHALAVAENPEIMTVQVPWMDLRVICVQCVCILENHIYHRLQLEYVHAIPFTGIWIGWRDTDFVVSGVVDVCRGRGVVSALDFVFHGGQVWSGRRNKIYIVDGPFCKSIDLVLCVQ